MNILLSLFLICSSGESANAAGKPCRFNFDCGWNEYCHGSTTFDPGICMPRGR